MPKSVQQLYSRMRRKKAKMGLLGSPSGAKAKIRISAKSRRILHFRRRRISREVEQPGSSSVNSHIAINQLVLTCVQQLYSKKSFNSPGSSCAHAKLHT